MNAPFEFAHTWRIDAPADRVFEALRDVERYPRWWREVKSVAQIDDRSGRVTIRSILPVSLKFVLRQEIVDPDGGVLQAEMTGDLDGHSRWLVRAHGRSTEARFTETALLTKPIPAVLAPLLRPIWSANHAAMMRSGRAGLSRYLRAG